MVLSEHLARKPAHYPAMPESRAVPLRSVSHRVRMQAFREFQAKAVHPARREKRRPHLTKATTEKHSAARSGQESRPESRGPRGMWERSELPDRVRSRPPEAIGRATEMLEQCRWWHERGRSRLHYLESLRCPAARRRTRLPVGRLPRGQVARTSLRTGYHPPAQLNPGPRFVPPMSDYLYRDPSYLDHLYS